MHLIRHKTVSDLYNSFGLPFQQKLDFSIHFLPDIHTQLPFSSGPFRSDYFSFVFIKDGSGTYTVDDQEFSVNPNTIYFTNPGHVKSFEITECADVYLITFSEAFLFEKLSQNVFEEYPFLLTENIPAITISKELFYSFETIYKSIEVELNSDYKKNARVIAKLFEAILIKCKTQLWQDRLMNSTSFSSTLQQFKQLLEMEFKKINDSNQQYKSLNAQDYADLLNLNSTYFNTLIKSKSGKTPGEWIQNRTLSAAKTLLRSTTLSIKEISCLLDFSEATHFGRFFKKQTQQTPVEYRNNKKWS